MPVAVAPPRTIQIHPADTVAVAVEPLAAGERVGGVTTQAEVPAGHKVALVAHAAGEPVTKYGFAIGRATAAIAPGEHVHSHNLATALDREEGYTFAPSGLSPTAPALDAPTWRGYRRAGGRVGTRNEVWVLNTVGCVNRTAERIARIADQRWGPDGEGAIDGAHAFAHPFGCSQLGGDLDRTRDVLAALARHPNAGGVVVLGLGCENNQLDAFLRRAAEGTGFDSDRVRGIAAQMVGDETEAGLDAVAELVEAMRGDRREEVPASDLVLGLKCGGSDGFSGVTANPLVGRVADLLVGWGGRAVLTEVPEMFGAERVLMGRAVSRDVFDGTVGLVNEFKRYFIDHDQPVYENPSPGNKAGGLTTLEEKSLGAIQKGGRAPIVEVVPYAGQASAASETGGGLALLEAPGNDGVSCTALTAAGCTVLLFTTGRGTPLGFPAPTVKIATNPTLAETKPHWIDFGAGPLLTGDADLDGLAGDLAAHVLRVASGERTRNEDNDYREIAIWKGGVTL
ncbi:UxaA family hydrolase [Rubrivirga sp.]|uniref:UxaA family hydrolase n=1 Tax=Rubrivirga sp. TaxID=1885344 RepID=UPI003B5222F4